MKKKVLILLISALTAASCNKDKQCEEVTVNAPAAEVTALYNYILANNITAVADPRGFFYTVANFGSGDKPTPCSGVTVNYIGKLTSGITFDSGTNASFYLSSLITGWKEGVPLIASGGSITLYLPPSLAYGSSANGSIPANSNLIFIIDLKAVY